MTEKLAYTKIKADGGTQMRAGLNQETAGDYADTMRRNNSYEPFPPVIVYFDGTHYWLGDGFHRHNAAFQAFGSDCTIPADVRAGTRRDAILHAAGANAEHGHRRSNADKRRAVETLLRDEEWSKWSDREIARRCAVSNNFVSEARRSLSSDDSERTYTTKHGTTATMQTANIGTQHRPTSPTPQPTPQPTPTRTHDSALPAMESPPADQALDRKISQLSSWLIAHGWGIMYAPMPQPCDVHKGETKFTFSNRDDKRGELEALRTAMAYEEMPPVDRRPSPPTARPLTDNEVEAMIWRGIAHHAKSGTTAHRLEWLQTAAVGDFSRLLNPGVSFEAEQMARIKAKVEAELNRQAKPATPAPASEPEPEGDEGDKKRDEYYTPDYILEPARKVLGRIDVDPASCLAANEVTRALTYYDKESNGLLHPWQGNVWLNPPYSNPLPWVEKLFAEYEAGRLTAALVLTNTANSPQWARLLWHSNGSVCLLSRRIKFWRADGAFEGKGFDRDQMIWYIGPTTPTNGHAKFRSVFGELGAIR